jgi:hypothetical protein
MRRFESVRLQPNGRICSLGKSAPARCNEGQMTGATNDKRKAEYLRNSGRKRPCRFPDSKVRHQRCWGASCLPSGLLYLACLLLFCAASLGLGLAGCATSEKIQPKQIGGREMSCREITAENRRLAVAARQVDSKRSVTGTNVASTLFWLSGFAYTYYDAG